MDFNGKVALVTGATRGLGRAIADKLAAGGASLIITATSNAIENVAAELKEKYNVQVESFYGDISQEETVKALFKLIEEKFGKLDICVNNAGITKDGLSMRMSAEDFDRVLTVNLRSTFLVSKEASMMMMKARYGKIVNMSSIVGLQGNVGQANYAASKAGIIGLTKSMAVELAKRNVTVNAVAPGFIDTDMTKALSDDVKAGVNGMIPMGKMGTTKDVAELVLFLAGNNSDYITGQVISVDGGMAM